MTDEIKKNFHLAADLVKRWGDSCVSGDRTLQDVLSVRGISLWSVIAPTLAFGHVPKILSETTPRSDFHYTLRYWRSRFIKSIFDAGFEFVGNNKGCETWSDKQNALFLGFSDYISRETLFPVAELLLKNGKIEPVIINDKLRQFVPPVSSGLKYDSLWRHWDNSTRCAYKGMLAEYKQILKEVLPVFPGVVNDSRMGFWREMKPVFRWFFYYYIPKLIRHLALAFHVVEKHEVSLLVSPDVHDPRTRIFCLVGKQFDVKTLEVQFSFCGTNNIEWRFFIADILAVAGKENQQFFVEHGVPSEKMILTGSPRYDSILRGDFHFDNHQELNAYTKAHKKKVLFASQPYYYGAFSSAEDRDKVIKKLFESVQANSNILLIVKPHPVEDVNILKKYAKRYSNIVFADQKMDIRHLIDFSDVFVTFFSTTTFDALLMKKPTVNLSFPGLVPNIMFEDCGATFVARKENDIDNIVQMISNNDEISKMEVLEKARIEFLEQWFYKLDGKASERIATQINNMI